MPFPSITQGSALSRKALLLLSGLVVANIGVWLITWASYRWFPFLIVNAALAYGFGLRHAVDADHICAIDNTTRKLMQEGKRPVGVGFFFSLGHSTVVFALCGVLTVASIYVRRHLPAWQDLGSIAGTVISGVFLYLIGVINLVVLWELYKTFRDIAQGMDYESEKVEEFLRDRGLLARLFKPLLRTISHSWQMYFVGFLFGLGFDTATEVGLLAIAAQSAKNGSSFWAIMLLPLLFTLGMCLIDTLDGVLMLGAYGWAFISPIRKLHYNVSITLLSVLVAFAVGTYEILQIVAQKLSLRGTFWDALNRLSIDNLGYWIIGAFVLVWALSVLVYKLRRYQSAAAAD